jgi:hypothetical protein
LPRIIVTTEPATEKSPGAIAEGSYDLADGKVHVKDAAGRPIGSEEVKPGDDPPVIARRILRKGKQRPGFYGPIQYSPKAIVLE